VKGKICISDELRKGIKNIMNGAAYILTTPNVYKTKLSKQKQTKKKMIFLVFC